MEVDKPGLPPRVAGRRRLIAPRPATRGENAATTALNATVVVTALARHAGTPRATSRRYSGAQTAATVTARNTVASTSRRMAAAATARTTIPERA
ncbi:hypothetical protein BRD03_02185 [Halobacteriales archaeon QS_9_68_17]|nr:MAG: hypothetical protein BRD03_02185 [Halobacteriales archaeon QS_9_68_17]